MSRRKLRPDSGRRSISGSVFINCPFESSYKPMFDAIVFAVIALNFDARSALARDTGTEERLRKIVRMIGESRFGIHDLSFMRVDPKTRLPRYNMAFELALFLGCCKYGGRRHTTKSCLILDRQRCRYRKSLTDLSGPDIQAHAGKPLKAIAIVRDWLATESGLSQLAGGRFVVEQYGRSEGNSPGSVKK